LGVIAGAAVGALIGVLFAPDKGSNTRRKIARKGEEWMDDVKVNLKDKVDHIRIRPVMSLTGLPKSSIRQRKR